MTSFSKKPDDENVAWHVQAQLRSLSGINTYNRATNITPKREDIIPFPVVDYDDERRPDSLGMLCVGFLVIIGSCAAVAALVLRLTGAL